MERDFKMFITLYFLWGLSYLFSKLEVTTLCMISVPVIRTLIIYHLSIHRYAYHFFVWWYCIHIINKSVPTVINRTNVNLKLTNLMLVLFVFRFERGVKDVFAAYLCREIVYHMGRDALFDDRWHKTRVR